MWKSVSAVMVISYLSWGCEPDNRAPAEVRESDVISGDQQALTTDAEVTVAGLLPELTGRTYRVSEMFATEPTDKLNDTWQETVDDYSLILLFQVLTHDPEAGTMVVNAGAGWAQRNKQEDGSFSISSCQFGLPPGKLYFQLDGTDFVITEPFSLDLFPLTVNKPFHIHNVVGHGHFSQDGSRIEEIYMDGFLEESEVLDFCLYIPGLGNVNFHWFMNLAGVCALADSDGNGDADSYNFKGVLRAADESHLFVEGIHPIEPQVTDCQIHDDPCLPKE